MALAIAHDDHGAEAEAPPALDNFRDAVDLNDAFFELKVVCVDAFLCHNSSEQLRVES